MAKTKKNESNSENKEMQRSVKIVPLSQKEILEALEKLKEGKKISIPFCSVHAVSCQFKKRVSTERDKENQGFVLITKAK